MGHILVRAPFQVRCGYKVVVNQQSVRGELTVEQKDREETGMSSEVSLWPLQGTCVPRAGGVPGPESHA